MNDTWVSNLPFDGLRICSNGKKNYVDQVGDRYGSVNEMDLA